ncbi:MAG: FHA domain-containing protein, partial [Gemmatimonadetes bacterium]|nr:FHA domain-containing protein [Gemmatimonadota bacterium]
MTYLSLREVRSGTVREFEVPEVRLGREPECEWPIAGEGSEVVSGRHARFFHRDGKWWVEDVGSRNGTSLNDRHLSSGHAEPVAPGAVVALGERGPRFRVEATEKRRIMATVIEAAGAARPSAPTMPMQALEDRTLPMQAVDAVAPPPAPPPRAAPTPP